MAPPNEHPDGASSGRDESHEESHSAASDSWQIEPARNASAGSSSAAQGNENPNASETASDIDQAEAENPDATESGIWNTDMDDETSLREYDSDNEGRVGHGHSLSQAENDETPEQKSDENDDASDSEDDENDPDIDADILRWNAESGVDEFSSFLEVLASEKKHQRRVQKLIARNQQHKDTETALGAQISGLEDEITNLEAYIAELLARLNKTPVPPTPWPELMRKFLRQEVEHEGDDGPVTWRRVLRACAKQENYSLKPWNVHPNLMWAGRPFRDLVLCRPAGDVQRDQALMSLERRRRDIQNVEVPPFRFDDLPLEIQQRIFGHLMVKPGLVHCVSRLNEHNEPESEADFPFPASGTSQLPNRFVYGDQQGSPYTRTWKPVDVLYPLLVSKRWLYLGIHAFYGMNTFAFSSLGEFGRFFKGIGEARTQRVAHIELLWQGSLMPAKVSETDRSRINQRTLPLQALTLTRRLETFVVFVEEAANDRTRRRHEFPRLPEENKPVEEWYRYDYSDLGKDFTDKSISDLNAREALLKTTAINANYRGFRSMRTCHGMDFVYQLRGVKWVRFYEVEKARELPQDRQRIRDWSFTDDISKVVTMPKTLRARAEADLRNLTTPTGLRTYRPRDEDQNMIAIFYDPNAVPFTYDDSEDIYVIEEIFSEDEDEVDVVDLEPNIDDVDRNDLRAIRNIQFPDEPGYQASSPRNRRPASRQQNNGAQGNRRQENEGAASQRVDPDLAAVEHIILPDEQEFQHDTDIDMGNSDDEDDYGVGTLVLDDPTGSDDTDLHAIQGLRFPDEPGYIGINYNIEPNDDGKSSSGDSDDDDDDSNDRSSHDAVFDNSARQYDTQQTSQDETLRGSPSLARQAGSSPGVNDGPRSLPCDPHSKSKSNKSGSRSVTAVDSDDTASTFSGMFVPSNRDRSTMPPPSSISAHRERVIIDLTLGDDDEDDQRGSTPTLNGTTEDDNKTVSDSSDRSDTASLFTSNRDDRWPNNRVIKPEPSESGRSGSHGLPRIPRHRARHHSNRGSTPAPNSRSSSEAGGMGAKEAGSPDGSGTELGGGVGSSGGKHDLGDDDEDDEGNGHGRPLSKRPRKD